MLQNMLEETESEPEVETTPALEEMRQNLDYARSLVRGGRYLQRLQVGAFDVEDLYRAAWVQAVSALDHWVHRELYDRATALALRPAAQRPAKYLRIEVPMGLLESVLHGSASMEEVFRSHLRSQFGHLSFQHPSKIKDALSFVSDVSLWPAVGKQLGTDHKAVQDRLVSIVKRRNRIAHETDRDHRAGGVRVPITDAEVTEVIDWLESLGGAILAVIGPPPPSDPAIANPNASEAKPRWTREDVDAATAALADTPAGTAIKALLAHADNNQALFKGGTGAEPSAGFYYWLEGKRRSLWSLYLTAERPVITVNLNPVWSRSSQLAHRMVALLRTQPTLDAALLHADDVVVQKYPVIELARIGESQDTLDTVLRTIDLAIQHSTGAETSST
ncbi:hypothetical protein JOF41_004982 [Saccharothrix coeruleofusca]|uniref:hypothetical protein n=1 Tax=Saccharothrix coeruleofusca TaxID=33919 RepID=UPI001AEA15EC|nr:hypothetical protein [Saccharothrix coeruleofusca]MBP2338804.1 hypothetical protein [Saccharothrix coeruleofusca]